MSDQELPEQMYGAETTTSLGQVVLHPTVDGYHDLVEAIHDDGYAMCIDLTAVDYLGSDCRTLPPSIDPQRFEVVAAFLNLEKRVRLRTRVQVPNDDPIVATITDLYPGAEALEREVFDMFGISFAGHNDLTRILMPEDWDGFPLRKDYEIGRIPVQFKAPTESGRAS